MSKYKGCFLKFRMASCCFFFLLQVSLAWSLLCNDSELVVLDASPADATCIMQTVYRQIFVHASNKHKGSKGMVEGWMHLRHFFWAGFTGKSFNWQMLTIGTETTKLWD